MEGWDLGVPRRSLTRLPAQGEDWMRVIPPLSDDEVMNPPLMEDEVMIPLLWEERVRWYVTLLSGEKKWWWENPPLAEGEKNPPRMEGEENPPRMEGEENPPRMDGEENPPRMEGEKWHPAQGEDWMRVNPPLM
jgi:hypothetical protein